MDAMDTAPVGSAAGPQNSAPTDFDRQRDLGILAQMEGELADVEAALERLEAGTYGLCEACSASIDDTHLEAHPAARFCRLHQELDPRSGPA